MYGIDMAERQALVPMRTPSPLRQMSVKEINDPAGRNFFLKAVPQS